MEEALRVTQAEWVARVLGVRLGGAAGPSQPGDVKGDGFKRRWQQSFAAWRDSIETVDQQMAALGAACRNTKDPWLMRIADLGLPAVTANHKTPLMAACLEVGAAPADKVGAAAAKAREAVARFAQHIATDPQVAGCDGNPFGVSVSLRGTLGPALKSLDDALRLAP
jgi:hypothetical protein